MTYRRPGRLGDAGFVNPDGTLTYDGQPYSPYDTSNPWNYDNQITGPQDLAALGYAAAITITGQGAPATLPLSVSALGPAPGTLVAPAPPVTGYTPLPSTASAPTTGVLSWLGKLFTPSAPTPYYAPSPYGTPLQSSLLPSSGGMSTTTILLLLALAGGAIVLSSRTRAS